MSRRTLSSKEADVNRVARRGPNSCTCVSRPVASLMLHRESYTQKRLHADWCQLGPSEGLGLACVSMDDRLCVSVRSSILSTTQDTRWFQAVPLIP